jgi:hypothetical protein
VLHNHTYKREINEASKDKTKGNHLKAKDNVDEDDKVGYPGIEGVMIIFGPPRPTRTVIARS